MCAMTNHQPLKAPFTESLENGLQYTEEIDQTHPSQRRECSLMEEGSEEPVSRLTLVPLRIRLGTIAVSAEGLGSVNTMPEHRNKGYISLLLGRAFERLKGRVNVAFLFGIENLYQKFGFVSCLSESSISVWIRRTKHEELDSSYSVHQAGSDDLPSVVDLYNLVHRNRPWTALRSATAVKRIARRHHWHPAPQIVLLKQSNILAAYAVLAGSNFGDTPRELTVIEASARDLKAARAMLVEIGARCSRKDISEFTVMEPIDSTIGRAAMQLGCSLASKWSPDGGGMAAILNRRALISELAGELRHRYESALNWFTAGRFDDDALSSVISEIAGGELVLEDGHLTRLLLGYWCWDDAMAAGATAPECHYAILRAIFPGSGMPWLPSPYSHQFDRY